MTQATKAPTVTIDWSEDTTDLQDSKQKETGIFHWKTKDGKMVPVDEMSQQEIEEAIKLCWSFIDRHASKIESVKRQMLLWSHRMQELEKALIPADIAEGKREITE